MPTDKTTTEADGELSAVLEQFDRNLFRAAEIDPEAWATPLRDKMHRRRVRSYFAAKELANG